MRQYAPIKIKVYGPTSELGFDELLSRVSQVHSDVVRSCVGQLDCPVDQKLQLIDAVIEYHKDDKTR